jgi:hypothetical protein
MKTTFLTLVLLVFGFSSFAFMPSFPAESNSTSEKNVAVSSEKPKTESENKPKTETKTVTTKELKEKMEANYEANKKEMSLKERIANKLLIKQLKKAEKKEVKGTQDSKEASIGSILRIIGIVFIIVGLIGLIASYSLGYVLTLILIGILFLILPSII